jgi:hypothetical protein
LEKLIADENFLLLAVGRKIIQYQHPSEPAIEQARMAGKLSVEEILTQVFRYQEWHRKVFGPTEKDRLTQGKKIYQWKADWL